MDKTYSLSDVVSLNAEGNKLSVQLLEAKQDTDKSNSIEVKIMRVNHQSEWGKIRKEITHEEVWLCGGLGMFINCSVPGQCYGR